MLSGEPRRKEIRKHQRPTPVDTFPLDLISSVGIVSDGGLDAGGSSGRALGVVPQLPHSVVLGRNEKIVLPFGLRDDDVDGVNIEVGAAGAAFRRHRRLDRLQNAQFVEFRHFLRAPFVVHDEGGADEKEHAADSARRHRHRKRVPQRDEFGQFRVVVVVAVGGRGDSDESDEIWRSGVAEQMGDENLQGFGGGAACRDDDVEEDVGHDGPVEA